MIRFTPEEESKLQTLEVKLGKKWEEIGRVMGRSGHSTFKKAHALKKEVGQFSCCNVRFNNWLDNQIGGF